MRVKCNFIFIIIFVLLISGYVSNKEAIVKINQTQVKVEVPQTLAGKIKGLSGRKLLGQDQGMLFIFDQPQKMSFWMKGMKFPIDIIFINAKNAKDASTYAKASVDKKLRKCEKFNCEYEVVDIAENLPAPKFGEKPASYMSKEVTNNALEVNAGFVQDNGIKIGDKVDIIW